MRHHILSGLAVTLFATSAIAGTVPILSGKYATSYNEICQQNNPNIPVEGAGATYTQILVANFNPSKGTVALNGTSVYGPLVGTYTALTQTSMSGSGTYSNTATTLTVTFSGQSATYSIAYGPVSKGIAQSAVFGGIDQSGCAVSAVGIRQ